jgi:hypothetical protein
MPRLGAGEAAPRKQGEAEQPKESRDNYRSDVIHLR